MLGDEYLPDDEGPEAKLFRRQTDAEKRQSVKDNLAIDRLLWDLRPEDAFRDLFTFAEVQKWALRRRRKL